MASLTGSLAVLDIEEQHRVGPVRDFVIDHRRAWVMAVRRNQEAVTAVAGVEVAAECLSSDAIRTAPSLIEVEVAIGFRLGASGLQTLRVLTKRPDAWWLVEHHSFLDSAMNKKRLRERIRHEAQLLRAMAERVLDIADHLEETANAINSSSIEQSRSRVYGESGGVAALKPQDIARRLEQISEEMTPNMDYLTNSSTNPKDYD